jgi:hypothetical protein
MANYDIRFCDFCQSAILAGQRWVREKIYDPRCEKQDSAYRRFHAEPFDGQALSCWEKRQMDREAARTALSGQNISQPQAARLAA